MKIDLFLRSPICAVLSLFVLAFSIYWPALSNQFAFDDLIQIAHNPALKLPVDWRALALEPIFPGDLYRPAVMLSYGVSAALFGMSPWVLHFDNVILHAANVALALAVFLPVLGLGPAWLLALLFAVHPLHTEAVANISGRAELLAAFFVLASILLTQRICNSALKPRTLLLLPILACTALLAVHSKESAYTLALLLPLMIGGSAPSRIISPGFILSYAVVGCVLCLSLWWRFSVIAPSFAATAPELLLDNPLVTLAPLERLAAALVLLGFGISKVIYPFPLNADFSLSFFPLQNFWIHEQTWLWAVLLVSFLLLLRPSQIFPKVSLFSFWLFLSIAITANIFFPIGTIFAERLWYLPSLGVLGVGLAAGYKRVNPVFGITLICTVAICWAVTVYRHAATWRDNTTLFQYQIAVAPASAKTQHNYGIVLRNSGKIDEASLHFREALRIYPGYADAAFGLASVYAQKGLQNGAEHWARAALTKDAKHTAALLLLARIRFNQQDLAEAEKLFRFVFSADTTNIDAQLGLLALAIAKVQKDEVAELLAKLEKHDLHSQEFVQLSRQAREILDAP
jgi:tetratricopeptide (TPR) repeat protein